MTNPAAIGTALITGIVVGVFLVGILAPWLFSETHDNLVELMEQQQAERELKETIAKLRKEVGELKGKNDRQSRAIKRLLNQLDKPSFREASWR